MKLRTVIINNAEFVDTRLQYKDKILNPKIFFLYKTSTWSELDQEFPARNCKQFTGSTTCLRNYPISKPYATAESVLQMWLTNPQEHSSSWRTNKLVFPRNPLQPSTQLDPRSFHWTPQLDPWSFHWTLSRWSFNPKNKNDYVLMFLKKSDWEDEEDEVSFRFLIAQNNCCYTLLWLVFQLFFPLRIRPFALLSQYFLYMKDISC